MFWSRKKREEDEDESGIEDESVSLEELLETFDASAEAVMKKRDGYRLRLTRVPLKWSVSLMTIGALLFSVLAVLFLWSGYKDVTDRLDTLPRVELSVDGFEFVGDDTYDNGKMGSGTFKFPIDFGVKEIDLPVYVGTDYETAFMKDKFAIYANRYTVYVKLYGDVYELYQTDASKIGTKVYTTDDLTALKKEVSDRGTFVIGTLFGLMAVGKFVFGMIGGLLMGTIVYGLVALGGRAKYVTYGESLRTGIVVSTMMLFVEIVILSLPMMYGPWLVMRVLLAVGTVLTALTLVKKAENGLAKEALTKRREELKSMHWEYTRERELAKMETLKEEQARKKRERKEAKLAEEAAKLSNERIYTDSDDLKEVDGSTEIDEDRGTE